MKIVKIVASFAFFVLINLNFASAQNSTLSSNVTPNKSNERTTKMAKELNLSEKQVADLKKLRDDSRVEKGKLNDKIKADRIAMHEKHDKQLRSILDEKQYYAFKEKAKNHKKGKHGKRGGKGNHGKRNHHNREHQNSKGE